VLLHQFHDILPGSSIAWVHREAEQAHHEIAEELEGFVGTALRALAGATDADADADETVAFNAAPHDRDGVPAMGASRVDERAAPPAPPVRVCAGDDGHLLDNGVPRARLDGRGLVTSLYDVAADREVLPLGAAANLLQLHPDVPVDFGAWDVDPFYRNTVTDLTAAEEVAVVRDDGDAGAVRVVRRAGASRVEQVVRLERGRSRLDVDTVVDWHETETLLKAAFPLDLHAERMAAETHFGHLHRPTHANTSWDAARFEVSAHRWVHVGEPGYGVAVVNDATYGHDVARTTREDGGTTTTVRLSLLRGPRFPDPQTDQGEHRFAYAVVVGADVPTAVREGYRQNLAERRVPGDAAVEPLVRLDGGGATVEAVKLADDRSGDVVVRLYEAHGGRARATLRTSFPLAAAQATDLLERPLDGPAGAATGGAPGRSDAATLVRDGDGEGGAHVALHLRPFQVVTLRLRPDDGGSRGG